MSFSPSFCITDGVLRLSGSQGTSPRHIDCVKAVLDKPDIALKCLSLEFSALDYGCERSAALVRTQTAEDLGEPSSLSGTLGSSPPHEVGDFLLFVAAGSPLPKKVAELRRGPNPFFFARKGLEEYVLPSRGRFSL
jgi:hypothetical protein